MPGKPPSAPNLAAFYRGLHRLIGRYHESLALVLATRPAIAKKAWYARKAGQKDWDALVAALLAQSDDFFDQAAAYGVEYARELLGIDVPPEIIDRIDALLAQRKDRNAQFVRDNLIADIRSGRYDAAQRDDALAQDELDEMLDDRAGRYAEALYPAAQEALVLPTSNAGVLINWVLDPAVREHCMDCPEIAAHSPYTDPDDDIEGGNPLPTYPGDGLTACGDRCYCSVEFEETSWRSYVRRNGLDE